MTLAPLRRVTASIERADALDATVDTLRSVVDDALPDGTPRAVLQGEPLGHPAHPIAVLIPAGAWISTALLDLQPGTERAARALVGAGVLAAAPAIATGTADWLRLRRRDQQRVGVVHWAANAAAVTLYAASYVQRRRGRTVSGKALAFAGLAVVSASGYLGGHLAYRLGANVDAVSAATEDAAADGASALL